MLQRIPDQRVLDPAGPRVFPAIERVIAARSVISDASGIAQHGVNHHSRLGIVSAIEVIASTSSISGKTVVVADSGVKGESPLPSVPCTTCFFPTPEVTSTGPSPKTVTGDGAVAGQAGVAVEIAVEGSDVAIAVIRSGIEASVEGAYIVVSIRRSAIEDAVKGANVRKPDVCALIPTRR